MHDSWPYIVPGLPDEAFVRGEVPMTKRDIRTLVMAKLRLTGKDICWDIGAGTGSVCVEMAMFSPQGRVIAVERKREALELLEINKRHFNLENIEIIPGSAPEALIGAAVPTRVFIGGSGGNINQIISFLREILPSDSIVVADFIVIENVTEALRSFARHAGS